MMTTLKEIIISKPENLKDYYEKDFPKALKEIFAQNIQALPGDIYFDTQELPSLFFSTVDKEDQSNQKYIFEMNYYATQNDYWTAELRLATTYDRTLQVGDTYIELEETEQSAKNPHDLEIITAGSNTPFDFENCLKRLSQNEKTNVIFNDNKHC
jgi:hypothetical protein